MSHKQVSSSSSSSYAHRTVVRESHDDFQLVTNKKNKQHQGGSAMRTLQQQQDDDLQHLQGLFGDTVPVTTMERVYRDHQCQFAETFEAILALSAVTDVETFSRTETSSNSVVSRKDERKDSTNHKKQQLSIDTNAHGTKRGIIDLSRTPTSPPDPVADKDSDALPKFKNDFEAWTYFQTQFHDLLSAEAIKEVWEIVKKEFWKDSHDYQTRVQVGMIYAQQRVDDVLGKEEGHDAYQTPILTDAQQCVQFQGLFQDIISKVKLEQIWNNITTEGLSSEEKSELAVLYAMEYLEEQHYRQSGKSNQSTDIKDNRVIDVEMDLMDVMLLQESRRMEEKHQQIQSTSLLKAKRVEQKQSTKEAAIRVVEEVFRDSVVKLSSQRIVDVLLRCQYDVEEAIAILCQEVLQDKSYVRHDLSYSQAAKKVHQNKKKGNVSISFGTSSSGKYKGSHGDEDEATRKKNLLDRTRSKHNPEYQFRFGEYFSTIVKRKNPGIKIKLSNDGEIVFEGFKASYNQQKYDEVNGMHMLMIVIDLHGIPVVQALQIVDSSLDHYYHCDGSKLHSKKIILKYIVGKGIHSPGGIPKIGSAVQQLLRDRNEFDFVPYEGEVLLYLTR